MKIAVVVILIVCILSGCAAENGPLEHAIELRENILKAESCSFQAVITADYEDTLYTFQMDCTADNAGNLQFTVTDPQTIAGITGTISQTQSALTFDNTVLAFPMLADGQATPVSTPWIFINTLRSGYITGCSREEEGLCIFIDDSYEEYPLHLEITTDENCLPAYAEIIWKERRILSMDIRNFSIQ